MLLQILNYMAREKIASNQQLAREFGLDTAALQPMLECWLRKGALALCNEKPACQSRCFKCRTQPPVYYRYVVSVTQAGSQTCT